MPFDMQVKLLRVLQSGEIQRVGGLRTVPVDLRIISATNVDLHTAIKQQKFRADLYYRISTLSISVAPLRERREDILPLTEYFMRRMSQRLQRSIKPLPPETVAMLLTQQWPGNVRQLESAVERAIHLAEKGVLLPEHFCLDEENEPKRRPVQLAFDHDGTFFHGTLEDMEHKAIADTLTRCSGNVQAAAKALGISRPTLYRKMKKMQREGLLPKEQE